MLNLKKVNKIDLCIVLTEMLFPLNPNIIKSNKAMNTGNFDVPNIFGEYGLVNNEAFYFYLNNHIPNVYNFEGVTFDKNILKAIEDKFGKNNEYARYEYIREGYYSNHKNIRENYLFILRQGCLFRCSLSHDAIVYHDGNSEKLEELLKIINAHIVETPKDKFYMVVRNQSRFELKAFKTQTNQLDLKQLYNSDFEDIHIEINSFLEANRSGLVILHGKQGTGKTAYIRHLIQTNSKQVIYMNAEIVSHFSDPDFITFLFKQRDSIIVIEDCEELLMARIGSSKVNAGLINILNMSDGLLGDALNLKFICTFNAPLKDIDKALLRKGRLVARYEFKDLSTEKANAIIQEQKLNISLQTKPIALAELFNYQKQNFEQAKIVIGF
jgi:hypothetical protein